jgi:DNA invertase Pin-like site-specific DNA recombinase
MSYRHPAFENRKRARVQRSELSELVEAVSAGKWQLVARSVDRLTRLALDSPKRLKWRDWPAASGESDHVLRLVDPRSDALARKLAGIPVDRDLL